MRQLRTVLAVVLLCVPAWTIAQQHRIAYVRAERPPPEYIDSLRSALRELGYIEGKNIQLDVRWADGTEEKLRSIVEELVRARVSVIIASAPAATRAAMDATSTIPIVMVVVADPVAFKFVSSLARPGGNVTGFAYLLPELSGKRLEILKQAAPQLSRVAVLWNAKNPYKPLDLREVQVVADALKIDVLPVPVNAMSEVEGALETAAKKGAGGLITLEDPFTTANRQQITALAVKFKLPGVHGLKPFTDAGGVMSYGPDALDQHRRAAGVVAKLLKGVKPAELPVERPSKFEFIINQKAAKAMGFAIPNAMLLRADYIIE